MNVRFLLGWSIVVLGSVSSPAFAYQESVDFSTRGQSMWGPGSSRPGDTTADILRESWSESGAAGGFQGFPYVGTFGARVSGSTSGSIGLGFGIEGIDQGSVAVDYPVTIDVGNPAANSYRPGQIISLTSGFLPEGGAQIVTGPPGSGALSLWADVSMSASLDVEVCAFGCLNVPFFRLPTFRPPDLPGLPGPPGLPSLPGLPSFRIPVFKLSFDIPNLISVGPFRADFTLNDQGNCGPGQYFIAEGGLIWGQSGIDGCFGVPRFESTSALEADGRTLRAVGDDDFIRAELDFDYWMSRLANAPLFSVGGDVKAATVFFDSIDVDFVTTMTLRQTFRFEPRPKIRLRASIPLSYRVGGGSFRSGTVIEFHADQPVEIVAPNAVAPLSLEYELDNLFSNDTEFVVAEEILERIFDAILSLNGIAYFCTPEICGPPGTGCCCGGCQRTPDVNLHLGPLITPQLPLKTFRDGKIFDGNRPPWKLGGFTPQSGGSFNLDPEFIPVPVIDGPSTLAEGSPGQFSALSSTDRDGDALSFRWYFGDETELTFGQMEAEPLHTFSDNGTFYVHLLATDGHKVGGELIAPEPGVYKVVTVTNVDPSFTGLDDFATGGALEGQSLPLTLSITDPGLDEHTVTIDWGDGSPPEVAGLDNQTLEYTTAHVYADNGTFSVQVCVADDDGGQSCQTTTATLANVKPTVAIDGVETELAPLNLGESLEVDALALSAFNDNGTLDTHTARLRWGDGQSDPLAVIEQPAGPPGSTAGADGSVNGSLTHVFTAASDYQTSICVTDDDGGETCENGPLIDVASANLRLTGVTAPAAPSPAPVGTTIRYTYTAANLGSDTADDVQVTVNVPQGATVLSAKRAGSATIERKLLAGDVATRGSGHLFGRSLHVAGDTLVVGAPGDTDRCGTSFCGAGAAYVFQRVGDDWQQTAKLTAGDGAEGDGFGGDGIAVSPDQSTIVIAATGVDTTIGGEGALYVYRRIDPGTPANRLDDTWRAEAVRLTSSSLILGMHLGTSVAIAGDLIAAGAPDGAGGFGALYVFRRLDNGTATPLDDSWTEQSRLVHPSPVESQRFGHHVAFDGATLVVASGGRLDEGVAGEVLVFESSGMSWSLAQTLAEADFDVTANTFSSGGLALQGDTLLVSSLANFGAVDGRLHGFTRGPAGFVFDSAVVVPTGGSVFSGRVALDGNLAVVGGRTTVPDASGFPRQIGTAELLRRGDHGWALAGRIVPSNAADWDDSFAGAANVGLVNGTVIAGAPLLDRLGVTQLGAVFAAQVCEERPAGRVVCGLGTIASGASQFVEVLARVDCNLDSDPFVSTNLTTNASVEGDVIDPNRANNVTSHTLATTDPPQDYCGADYTPPVIVPIVDGTLGSNGWYVSDVSVDWSVTDPESAITATTGCGTTLIDADTAGVILTCEATHTAGNGRCCRAPPALPSAATPSRPPSCRCRLGPQATTTGSRRRSISASTAPTRFPAWRFAPRVSC